jgi:hypothetical protein
MTKLERPDANTLVVVQGTWLFPLVGIGFLVLSSLAVPAAVSARDFGVAANSLLCALCGPGRRTIP